MPDAARDVDLGGGRVLHMSIHGDARRLLIAVGRPEGGAVRGGSLLLRLEVLPELIDALRKLRPVAARMLAEPEAEKPKRRRHGPLPDLFGFRR